jgi:hypothetical protein
LSFPPHTRTPNSSTTSFNVTVRDTQNPVISCPANIALDAEAGTCGAVATYTAPVGTDNCAVGLSTAQTAGLASGSTFPTGVTTNTFVVTDAGGNTATCSFTVTVTDTQSPAISCQGNLTANTDAGQCDAAVAVPDVTFSDNCSGSSISWSSTGATTLSGSGQPGTQQFSPGVTTVTVTVTDTASPAHTASCSFTVTVTDAEVPTINCPSNITADNDSGAGNASIAVPDATFGDNCSGSSIAWSATGATTGSGSGQIGTHVFNVGETTVTYTVTDGATPANTATCSFTVTVNDILKPVISGCPSNITRTSSVGDCTAAVTWTEPSATDNATASGSLVWTKSHLPGDTFQPGTTTVTYTATDLAANVSDVCSFTVTVTDNQKPVLSGCPTNITTTPDPTSGCTRSITWVEPSGTDNCTATNNLVWTKSHTPGSVFSTGSTTVTYTATDANGNVSLPCSFTVTVNDNVNPVATCKPDTIFLNGSGVATLSVTNVNNGSSDNCTAAGDLIITLAKTAFNCSDKGVNVVAMTVKDASGNTASCNASVTVADAISPVIVATAGTVSSSVNVSSGNCYYVVNGSVLDPLVTDNCPGATTLSYTVSGATTLSGTGSLASKQLSKGANVVTWTATDGSGNSALVPLTFTITVSDNQAPLISAKSNQSRNTNTGCGYTANGTEFDVTITDNCSITSTTYTINGGTPVSAATLNGIVFSKGTSSVVWTATDGTNTSTRTFQVTVADDDAPVITNIANITQNVPQGSCTAVVTWTAPTATDNCDGAVSVVRVLGPASGSTFPVGTTPIRFSSKDAAGNISLLNFNVIVTDGVPPSITCPAGSTLLSPFQKTAGAGVCTYTVVGTEFNASAAHGCSFTLTNSFDGSSTLTGKKLPVGDHAIVWTASNGSVSSACTIYVHVTDNQNPTYSSPKGADLGGGNFSYAYARYTDPGKTYFTVPGTGFDLSSISDNCGTQTPTYVISHQGAADIAGSNSLAGVRFERDVVNPYTIVWTLTDVNSNTVTAHSFTISVTDNQPPSFVCHGNLSRTIPSGACKYLVNTTEFDPTALTDNCDAGSLTLTYTLDGVSGGVQTSLAGVELLGGEHTIIWTLKDLSNNSTTCTFKVTVVDPVLPVISTITNQTKNAPADLCYYKAVGTEFNPTVTDNCPNISLVNNQNSGSTLANFEFPVGITVVVWTATDLSGNVTTMQYQVTVLDITAPSYTLPATASKNTASNSCYYTTSGAEFDPQIIDDNCTKANYTIINNNNNYRSLAFVQFPVGTTNVQWSVKDNYGNESLKTIAITVTDNVNPVISCPGSAYTRVVDTGQTYYTVGSGEFKPVAYDNCSLTSYTNSLNSTSSLNSVRLNVGTHVITWTALDAAGNSQTCDVTINVVTDLYPAITGVGDKWVNNTTGTCGYTVSGTSYNATSAATLTNDFNNSSTLDGASFPVGTTLVTWTASQTINGTTYQNYIRFYVFVTDTEHPAVTAPADISTTTNTGCFATIADIGTPTTSDNCAIYRTTSNAPYYFPIGDTNVTWLVEDIYGNVSTAVQKVTVADDDVPYISCPVSFCREVDGTKTYYTVNGHEFDLYETSDCSGISSITHNVAGTPSNSSLAGALFATGPHTVVWTVVDNSPAHNTTTCTVSITINDTDPPSVTCRGNIDVNTDAGICTYTVPGTALDVASTSTPAPVLTHNIQTADPNTKPYAPSANTLLGVFTKPIN